MAFEEVAVDETPETDFNEISVEEEPGNPPDEGEKAKPEEEKQTDEPSEKKADEPPPDKELEPSKELDLTVEKLKKDVASMGYSLREINRQKAFLEEQLRKERENQQKQLVKDGLAQELDKIKHLRDVDPDAYIREHTRITEAQLRKEMDVEREALRANSVISQAQARRQKVEERLVRDYPDINDQGSELFIESQKTLQSRYAPEEVALMLNSSPEVFLSIVGETATRLKLKKLESAKADKSREDRVRGQGVVEGAKKSSATEPGLSREQLQFCKDNDFDPKEYAKFVGKGRR